MHVVEILYICLEDPINSVSWLLISWQFKEQKHQQLYYWHKLSWKALVASPEHLTADNEWFNLFISQWYIFIPLVSLLCNHDWHMVMTCCNIALWISMFVTLHWGSRCHGITWLQGISISIMYRKLLFLRSNHKIISMDSVLQLYHFVNLTYFCLHFTFGLIIYKGKVMVCVRAHRSHMWMIVWVKVM